MRRRDFLAMIGATACGRRDPPRAPSSPDVHVAAPDAPPDEEPPPALPPLDAAPADDLRAFAAGVERLCVSAWTSRTQEAGDAAMSPAAVALCMSMAVALMKDAVAEEAAAALAPGLDAARLHRAAGTMLRAWGRFGDRPGFSAGQRPFLAQRARETPAAFVRLRSIYGAPPRRVVADATEGIRSQMNDYVARTTGVRRGMVAADTLVAEVPLHEVGAALATLPMGKAAAAMRFRVGAVMPVETPALVVAGLRRRAVARATVWRVPLAVEGFTLDLLVPDEGARLREVEPAALSALLRGVVEGDEVVSGEVALPRLFAWPDFATPMRAHLWAPYTRWFDPEASAYALDGFARTWLSELFHATSVAFAPAAPDGDVRGAAVTIDRPFTWVLRDARRDLLLALGRVFDPRV